MNSNGHTPHEQAAVRRGRLTIASYNLHSCVGLDRRCSPARISQVLRELDCDIYALQEVDIGLSRKKAGLEMESRVIDEASVLVRYSQEKREGKKVPAFVEKPAATEQAANHR